MSQRIEESGLQVAKPIHDLVNQAILPGTGVSESAFWVGFAAILAEFGPRNRALLDKRDQLQAQIDQWHSENSDGFEFAQYKAFLQEIGYLVPEGGDFAVSPDNVDTEIAVQAGPQLVVPIMNARFALNAVNARWGSLYDALYGNDVISEEEGAEKAGAYNPARGQKVIDYGRDFLDDAAPLSSGSHHQATRYTVVERQLKVQLESGSNTTLQVPEQLSGYLGDTDNPSSILIKNNNLYLELQVDCDHQIGASDKAGVMDIVLESALTTIMDCEDSVAAVDAEDKALAYGNWLGLIKGTLEETITRGDTSFVRSMNADRTYTAPDGSDLTLNGRSLMFIRNVGHLMTNPAILDAQGSEIPEGIMDGVISSLISLHDINNQSKLTNSAAGSIYIVKPKMHGPEEVAFTNDLFDAIEDLLGLARHTIKVGIMDEERRTSVNLTECIRAAKGRVVFINTGFLDRTGDEIHTSMLAGAFALKGDLKKMAWITAYEDNNVDVGLACGLKGKAQIGKGMWAIPDNMAEMMAVKIGHPKAGANTAWVPSPTAATLHAMHYHQINVPVLQETLKTRLKANVDDILTIPLLGDQHLTEEDIQLELDNNVQGMLGYVVRWVEQGVGCSKVPDINNVGLMEDRATLRISSQHIANWLHHGICSSEQVMETLKRMAIVVDGQNSSDPEYVAMSTNFDTSIAFSAACDLVYKGLEQPSGYTEPLLHRYRQKVKG
ncbi:MAG: malate synthase G [Porticoccaceae bacterium]|nr:malate synthase G [Porticoccaceae bacterium]MBT4164998.1 malate synthase G [Porticoccaceae bacterium]MBT5104082.1 malate synthase G [Porticoccaceae bacterium]MBT6692298.1 malate synthase G [Porticoccaceae bacterium]MBT7167326.1 malate synthase G [Porticoccaceae bacterium]